MTKQRPRRHSTLTPKQADGNNKNLAASLMTPAIHWCHQSPTINGSLDYTTSFDVLVFLSTVHESHADISADSDILPGVGMPLMHIPSMMKLNTTWDSSALQSHV